MLITYSLVPRIQNKLGNPNWATFWPQSKHFLRFVSQPEGSVDKHIDQDTLAAGVTEHMAVGLSTGFLMRRPRDAVGGGKIGGLGVGLGNPHVRLINGELGLDCSASLGSGRRGWFWQKPVCLHTVGSRQCSVLVRLSATRPRSGAADRRCHSYWQHCPQDENISAFRGASHWSTFDHDSYAICCSDTELSVRKISPQFLGFTKSEAEEVLSSKPRDQWSLQKVHSSTKRGC